MSGVPDNLSVAQVVEQIADNLSPEQQKAVATLLGLYINSNQLQNGDGPTLDARLSAIESKLDEALRPSAWKTMGGVGIWSAYIGALVAVLGTAIIMYNSDQRLGVVQTQGQELHDGTAPP